MPFALCLLLFAFSSLQAQDQRFTYSHPQMGTVFKLTFYAPDEATAQKAQQAVFDQVDTMNAIMSDYLPESELNRLCATAGTGQKVAVSADLWAILQLSQHFSKQSDGAFDISVGALTRLWRRARRQKELPEPEKIAQAKSVCNYHFIRLYKKGKRVELRQKGMQLDLGGIAQGYAADRCLQILRSYGITRALADAGGDIALGDAPPDKSGWEIRIPGPDSSANILVLHNCGITTSGAKYQFLEVDGLRYSHIIDPRTGWGLQTHTLVTVQAPIGVEADAWATALSVLGEKGWQKIRRKHPELKVWLYETPLNP